MTRPISPERNAFGISVTEPNDYDDGFGINKRSGSLQPTTLSALKTKNSFMTTNKLNIIENNLESSLA
jgi:hypothetical protein